MLFVAGAIGIHFNANAALCVYEILFFTFLKDTGVVAHTTEHVFPTLADEFGMLIVETDAKDFDKVPYVLSRPELPFGVAHPSH